MGLQYGGAIRLLFLTWRSDNVQVQSIYIHAIPICKHNAEMHVVDVHTHVYPPSYVELLKSRTSVPYIRAIAGSEIARLIILPGEDDSSKPPAERGRPIGPEYWDINRKIAFMDKHNIDISIISLANPWLDFLPASEAASTATDINDSVNDLCSKHPGRLFAMGTLPLSGEPETVVSEIRRLKSISNMRGVIMGTGGLGKGLDDPRLDVIWDALADTETIMFLHPHYGLPNAVYGEWAGNYGHVLSLALGFPLETTIAVTRMYLSGVWERHPELKVLLAHSGGTLPFLAGRIESCIEHDGYLKREGKLTYERSIGDVLRDNIYLDAVIYSSTGLKAAIDVSDTSRAMFGKSTCRFCINQSDQRCCRY